MRPAELVALLVLVEGTGRIQPDRCTVDRSVWLQLTARGYVAEHWEPTLLPMGARGYAKAAELSHYSLTATGRVALRRLEISEAVRSAAERATLGPFVGRRIVKVIATGAEKVIAKGRPVRGRRH